ncbi:BatD family protein [Halospina sp. K52047b]|uniref:BatD family protein n=1 Tax=Halospina sp. K52047b TaxID=2614160 RepID=UPI00124A8469|nr:BatD family protein [Halospina sp. K52047b]KAA8984270.1 protein BatD [Halospina sp. K52047b]
MRICRITLCTFALLAMLTGWSSIALADLTASANPKRLYANELITLTLDTETELDFSLGSLLNPAEMDIPHPNTAPLEHDFRILDRHQRMAIQSKNGVNRGQVTWTFLLAPRRAGELTIPALQFQDMQSRSIDVTVMPGVAPAERAEPEARLDVNLSEGEVYVQQQIILTQRVYYEPPLAQANLSSPTIPDAMVKPLGEQREYRAERDGREWQVVERRFVIVPQSAGTLILPEQRFEARKQTEGGDLVPVIATAPSQRIKVHPPPESFTGEIWLPARNLELTQEWSDSPESVHAGDSIRRDIHIRAVGVAPESLPRLTIGYPDSLREYPSPWKSESRLTGDSIEGRLRKRSSLVPIEPGRITLPEVRIPWWDVEENEQREAVLQAHEMKVEPAAGAEANESAEKDVGEALSRINLSRPGSTALPPLWFWLAVVLASGWLITGIAWWRNRHTRDDTLALSTEEKANRERFRALCEHARRGEADTLTLLPHWAAVHFNRPSLRTVGDVTAYLNDPQLTRELQALERHLFANPDEREAWEGDELVGVLRRLAGRPRNGS